MLTRKQATERILEAKKAKNLTFETIAKAVGKHKVWVTAALLGQGTMSKDEAARATEILGLGADVAAALQEIPTKGSLDSTVPVDPLITVGNLPNGLRYYVRRNAQPQGRAELRLAVNAGSASARK